ncbi:MAG: 4Fe-4S binding protein [Dehalococcoidia bacterium]|nr:4Fe-4S binding protein [Dehalococcoidia bacterium]
MKISHKLVLHFPPRIVEQPVINNLIRNYDLSFNILKASIIPNQEGYVVLELSGEQDKYDAGIEYVTSAGVQIESLSRSVLRNEERCTHCGACVSVCPSRAFSIAPQTRKVCFDDNCCVACGLCIKACPPRAMEFHF